MITGMDRLRAALEGGCTDRVPVFCNLIDQGAKELGMSLETYYSKGVHVAEGQLRMREKYGYDNVWSLFYVGKEAEVLGCRDVIYAPDGPPNVNEFVIKTHADVEKLVVPDDLTTHPGFVEQLDCLKLLKAAVGGKHPICAYITSSMSLPAMLMGMEKWMELLFLGPAEVREHLLNTCFDYFVKQVAVYRQAGADVLVYANPFGSTDTVPLNYFNAHVLPWIQKEVGAAGTAGLVYYCGMSRLTNVIARILETTDVGAFYLSPLDDVAAAKRIVAARGLTCGVINDIKLLRWQPPEIRRQVKRLFDAGMPGGRFLFGTGVMPYNIPEANIRTMLNAAYEYGRCP